MVLLTLVKSRWYMPLRHVANGRNYGRAHLKAINHPHWRFIIGYDWVYPCLSYLGCQWIGLGEHVFTGKNHIKNCQNHVFFGKFSIHNQSIEDGYPAVPFRLLWDFSCRWHTWHPRLILPGTPSWLLLKICKHLGKGHNISLTWIVRPWMGMIPPKNKPWFQWGRTVRSL